MLQAYSLGDLEIEEKCLKLIDEYGEKTLDSQGFPTIQKSTLNKIMCRESLSASEVSVYRAAVRWAQTQCERLDKPVCIFTRLQCEPTNY